MHQLRIVGVEAEGERPRLVLSDEAGAEYGLPLDQALKSAVSSHTSPTPSRVHQDDTTVFAPREIQARLRAGATVAQVVEASGLTEERVLRYAGPVADERAYYASRARGTVVARASTAENHRLAFGDAAATLEDMVSVRLRAVGVKLNSLSWDAWRRQDGLWAVLADFDATSSEAHAEAIGQRPPAEWVYDPSAHSVNPVNKWAESLSALPPTAAARRTGPRLAAVEEPFDVDQDAPSAPPRPAAGVRQTGSPKEEAHDHEDLLDILRARRGQRLGSDESGDEKLATLLTREEQTSPPEPPDLQPVRSDAEADSPQQEDESGGTDAWGFSYEDSADEDPPVEAPAADEPEEAESSQSAQKRRSSSRRPTMPRWDDILFGSKNE